MADKAWLRPPLGDVGGVRMTKEEAVNAIWEAILDSYGLNVELDERETIVYSGAWEKEMKAHIRAILDELVDETLIEYDH